MPYGRISSMKLSIFSALPGDLDDHRGGGDVDDAAAEDVDEVQDLGALTGRRVHPHQHQLVRDVAQAGDVVDGDDVDELGQLLGRLLGLLTSDVHGDGHPRHRVVVGRADRQ